MSLKKKIRANEPTLGSWITLGLPEVGEIMARSGFDWLAIDLEHSAIGMQQAQNLIQVISLAGCSPLVRVSSNDAVQIKRVLDAGAHGIIVPMVNTQAEAERAVASAYYPPRGNRGVGLARAQGYGQEFEEYRKWLAEECILIAQVEHADSIRNLDKILQVEEIDATIIGPYDLSASLGIPGEFDDPRMLEQLTRYESLCAKFEKPMGIHVIPPEWKQTRDRLASGYRFLGWSLDSLFLGGPSTEGVRRLKQEMVKVP